jgi:hypothetical protein
MLPVPDMIGNLPDYMASHPSPKAEIFKYNIDFSSSLKYIAEVMK